MFRRDSTGPCGQTGRDEGEDGVAGKSERKRASGGRLTATARTWAWLWKRDLGRALSREGRHGLTAF